MHKIRRACFSLAAALLFYSGLLRFWILARRWARGSREICIIGLHRILSDEQRLRANSLQGIILRERTFAKMLEFIRHNFTVLSLAEFLEGDAGSASTPPCLLTFDDGWRDNFTTALPWLKKFQMPAIIFAVTGLIEGRETFWIERLDRVWRTASLRPQFSAALESFSQGRVTATSFEAVVEFLKHLPARSRDEFLKPWLSSGGNEDCGPNEMFTWEEASVLENDGVAIEAHTVTHPLLVYEDAPTVEQELANSKRTIEDKLKKKVRAFAYPNGSWNDRVRRQVQEAGYDCAFITAQGLYHQGEDAFTIRRIMLHEGKVTGLGGEFSPAITALRLTGWF